MKSLAFLFTLTILLNSLHFATAKPIVSSPAPKAKLTIDVEAIDRVRILKPDVQAWDGWPARQTNLIFGGMALGEKSYLDLWQKLEADPTDPEVQRNIGITQPLLWIQ